MAYNSINRIRRSAFVQNVAVLLSGAVLGQAFTLLSVPLLTRIYGLEGFAVFAVFAAIISSISPAISGRYEIAVAIADTQADRKKLVLVAFWLTAILSGLVFSFITFSDNRYPSLLNADLLGSWFYLVPITLFLFGLRSILLRYANGQQNYQLISQNSFLQPFATAALGVVFGVIGFQQSGLLLSYTAAFYFSVIFIIWNYKGEFIFSDIRLTKYHYKLAVKYKQFPY